MKARIAQGRDGSPCPLLMALMPGTQPMHPSGVGTLCDGFDGKDMRLVDSLYL